jgi:ribA/ribD-fused uncharacterized protein
MDSTIVQTELKGQCDNNRQAGHMPHQNRNTLDEDRINDRSCKEWFPRQAYQSSSQPGSQAALRRPMFDGTLHYVLSNFSAIAIKLDCIPFASAVHAYHWFKFRAADMGLAELIRHQSSAHEALRVAVTHQGKRPQRWNAERLDIMRRILRAKLDQHPFVCRKLLATGNSELSEYDLGGSFWGRGKDNAGQNWMGKLWIELRTEYQVTVARRVRDFLNVSDTDD